MTNSKCAAVLNQKKLHLLLKDQYIVSAGLPEGMFSDRLFTFGNYSASTALNCCSLSDGKRETPKQKFNKSFFFPKVFRRILVDSSLS